MTQERTPATEKVRNRISVGFVLVDFRVPAKTNRE
jgi:hypothetical protein